MQRLLVFFLTVTALGLSSLHAQFQYVLYDTDGIPPSVYAARRDSVVKKLGTTSVLAVVAADVRNRENDVDHEYRQDSDLLYLTGYPDPGATLLIVPAGIEIDGTKHTSVLFTRERRREQEQWTGLVMGPAEATKVLGIMARPVSELKATLEKVLASADSLVVPSLPTVMLPLPLGAAPVTAVKELTKHLASAYPNLKVKTSFPRLAAMREVKDTAEIRLLRKAIAISIEGHLAAIKKAKPGSYEYQVEADIEHGFKHHGAEDVGYPSIVGSKYNACILHYTTNRRKTNPGDLILADCGAEYHGYTADITRTFPVSGRYTKEQRTLYDVVLEAQDSGIAAAKVGAPFNAMHGAAKSVITRRLTELGIVKDAAEVSKYFMHGTSHYLGLDVHDPGTYGPLRPGVVVTVEPGIYIAEDSPCDRKWWNIGIRIEDDILVTEQGPENMSVALPRAAAEIEALMHAQP
ncbi:MAG: M24 family metallopeptidase [Candidatus Kapabacteria bacterium]|nr:M24 family metallopeptidase [Candidatus Kapabacteria bacterium]